ncbi:hypothetical protein CSO01_04550 [Cellulomonas soli]|uniref:Uncharacterized protein n=1 Tax=Cellulomonas soli TaxID=931535 RepID=A0A512P978_9CELL|nr:hypothetical protein CSO01_04550 [Cellulomonas soli]
MAGAAYGRKIAETMAAVRYTYGREPDTVEGTLVIPTEDPDAWYIEDSDERPMHASWVFIKAYRAWRASGEWPERSSFYA